MNVDDFHNISLTFSFLLPIMECVLSPYPKERRVMKNNASVSVTEKQPGQPDSYMAFSECLWYKLVAER